MESHRHMAQPGLEAVTRRLLEWLPLGPCDSCSSASVKVNPSWRREGGELSVRMPEAALSELPFLVFRVLDVLFPATHPPWASHFLEIPRPSDSPCAPGHTGMVQTGPSQTCRLSFRSLSCEDHSKDFAFLSSASVFTLLLPRGTPHGLW